MNKLRPTPLRLARISRGLTLSDVSKALRDAGVKRCSLSLVSLWERGMDVPPEVAPLLAKALGLRRLP